METVAISRENVENENWSFFKKIRLRKNANLTKHCNWIPQNRLFLPVEDQELGSFLIKCLPFTITQLFKYIIVPTFLFCFTLKKIVEKKWTIVTNMTFTTMEVELLDLLIPFVGGLLLKRFAQVRRALMVGQKMLLSAWNSARREMDVRSLPMIDG